MSACGGGGGGEGIDAISDRQDAGQSATKHILALAPDASVTRNGLYRYAGTNSFPTSSTRGTNYWVDVVFSPTLLQAEAVTIWPTDAKPVFASNQWDPASINLGVSFQSDVSGYITGVRFYKGSANTGVHVGTLWSSTGEQLASATFTNESAIGWQQVNFSPPVAIKANTVYVASYLAPQGGYAADRYYFTDKATDRGPLHALQDGVVYTPPPPPIPPPTFITPLYDASTPLEPVVSFVRADGVVVTRFGDRGRDRHAKDIGYYDPKNIFNSDHYDHYLAHYWEYRTARVQLEDYVANGQSLIRATYVTEAALGAKEFRVWYSGVTTTGQFLFNPVARYVGRGTWNNDFVKTSETGSQFMYTVDITQQWKNVATFNGPLRAGVNMEFEISQFLISPPAGLRKNYYGTSFVYVIGKPGLAPFEWAREVKDRFGTNDGTPIPTQALLGGAGTLGYNYSEEPAGRFMQMATNLSPGNAQPFVRGRRVFHTDFENGIHGERSDNPVWTEQIGKAGNHYVNRACAACHVRNGRALVADVGVQLDKWVFKVADAAGQPDPLMGSVLQPSRTGAGAPEGTASLGPWTELVNGLRTPNYVFSQGRPARFSARIAPQLVGLGLLDAVAEDTVMAWADPDDADANGISGRASVVRDPQTGASRLGRFGYKAAAFSVRHQLASALNTDIGVMTRMLPKPDCGSRQTDCGPAGQELSDEHLEDLVKYISLLGVGARRAYNDRVGEQVFSDIGCAACHRPTMTTSAHHPLAELRNQTIRPYSDLLLHDMGPGLADDLGEGNASGAEWRTAPLWGLGHARNVMLGDRKANDDVSRAGDAGDVNRIGYLHDGRARTLDEAIRWHGGEAEAARRAYEARSKSDKDALIAFLMTL